MGSSKWRHWSGRNLKLCPSKLTNENTQKICCDSESNSNGYHVIRKPLVTWSLPSYRMSELHWHKATSVAHWKVWKRLANCIHPSRGPSPRRTQKSKTHRTSSIAHATIRGGYSKWSWARQTRSIRWWKKPNTMNSLNHTKLRMHMHSPQMPSPMLQSLFNSSFAYLILIRIKSCCCRLAQQSTKLSLIVIPQ